MADLRDTLETLKFELAFLEQGGYGRSPHTPWRQPEALLDSPSCVNFGDATRSIPCDECLLMQFVPPEHRGEAIPCHHIPLDKEGETVHLLERWGTQPELEEKLANWLRKTIARLEEQHRNEQLAPAPPHALAPRCCCISTPKKG
jgi:hypothetical protein